MISIDLGLLAALIAWCLICLLGIWAALFVRVRKSGPARARWWRGEAPPGCDWWTQEPRGKV